MTNNGNVPETKNVNEQRRRPAAPEDAARLWWLIVARCPELELRRRARTGPGHWRFRCPVDGSHAVTLLNGNNPPGLVLTCHGPAGQDSPGHSLSTHRRHRDEGDESDQYSDLGEIAYPCRFCGCTESMVLAALGARTRDRFRQSEAQRDGRCRCGSTGYKVGRLPVLCLAHLSDRVGLARDVLFGEAVQ